MSDYNPGSSINSPPGDSHTPMNTWATQKLDLMGGNKEDRELGGQESGVGLEFGGWNEYGQNSKNYFFKSVCWAAAGWGWGWGWTTMMILFVVNMY